MEDRGTELKETAMMIQESLWKKEISNLEDAEEMVDMAKELRDITEELENRGEL